MTITRQIYRRLLEALGPQHWWPGDSPWEVMIGAVLVQNTSWKNVERAIENLREANLIEPHRLLAVSPEELAELIRPAGYYRLKTKRLRSLLEFVVDEYGGSLDALRSADMHQLREALLGVHGIGPETADSILLYALEQPALVVDTYTHRVFARHGWIDYDADYHRLQEHLTSELPVDVALYNELHALMVNVGHHFCRRRPKCDKCPLLELLPEGGIVSPDC
jgi:endonuclease-3 related protein